MSHRKKGWQNKMRHWLWHIQKGTCYWCGCACRRDPVDIKSKIPLFTLDHIQARRHGGQDHEGNVVGACDRCNQYRNITEFKFEAGKPFNGPRPEIIRMTRLFPEYDKLKFIALTHANLSRLIATARDTSGL